MFTSVPRTLHHLYDILKRRARRCIRSCFLRPLSAYAALLRCMENLNANLETGLFYTRTNTAPWRALCTSERARVELLIITPSPNFPMEKSFWLTWERWRRRRVGGVGGRWAIDDLGPDVAGVLWGCVHCPSRLGPAEPLGRLLT